MTALRMPPRPLPATVARGVLAGDPHAHATLAAWITANDTYNTWFWDVQTDFEGNAVSHLLSAAEAAGLSAALSPAPADEGREAVDLLAKAIELLAHVPSHGERNRRWRIAADNVIDEAEALFAAPMAAAPPAPAVPEERDEAVDEDGAYWIGTPAERPTSRRCQDCGGSGTSWDTLGKITCPTCDGSGCESEAHVLAARPAPVTAAPTEDRP